MSRAFTVLAGIAAVGVATVSSTAFTATGIDRVSVTASRFLGGTVSQSVTGATLEQIDYVHGGAGTSVTQITLQFTAGEADGRAATVTSDPGGVAWSCVDGTLAAGIIGDGTLGSTSGELICTHAAQAVADVYVAVADEAA